MKINNFKFGLILYFLLFNLGCERKPVPINLNEDTCEHCKMTIVNNRFGGEIVTKKGKIFKFDAVECLVSYYLIYDKEKVSSLWVINFLKPAEFVNAKNSFYLQSKKINSPMGAGILAVAIKNQADKLKEKYGGEFFNWEEILKLIKK